MSSSAMLHRLESGALAPTRGPKPLILVDGMVCDDLAVLEVKQEAPLGTRTARMNWQPTENAAATGADRWFGRHLAILVPIGLSGGDSRVIPIFHGVIDKTDDQHDADHERHYLTARCEWADVLDQKAEDRFSFDDRVMNVESAVEQLQRSDVLKLAAWGLPEVMRQRPVRRPRGDDLTWGQILESLCSEADLQVDCLLHWTGTGVRRSCVLRPVDRGRPNRIATGEMVHPATTLASLRGVCSDGGPVKYIARSSSQVVESTFQLCRGWDPAGEGLADEEYSRSQSSDFDAGVNVYRLWVLNEDGAFSGEPFLCGDAYDAAVLFEAEPGWYRQPLPFLPTLSQSAEGRSLGHIVEVSEDAGATWSQYGGRVETLDDRAGVWLADDVLPAGFLTAIKAGAARVRVTACLRSPDEMQMVRWRGNPFTGQFTEKLFDVSGLFAWRRVAASSKFYARVQSGLMRADEADDRLAMQRWLVAQSGEAGRGARGGQLRLNAVDIGWRCSDRLAGILEGGGGLVLDDQRFSNPVIEQVIHDFECGCTTLHWFT